MYSRHALSALCEVSGLEHSLACLYYPYVPPQAYHRGFHSPQYLFMTTGAYGSSWWKNEVPGLSCTAEQRASVLLSSIVIRIYHFPDETKDANLTTSLGIVSSYGTQDLLLFPKTILHNQMHDYTSPKPY